MYHPSSAVFCDEAIKLVICTVLAITQEGVVTSYNPVTFFRQMFPVSSIGMAVPAFLYALQKQLLYRSISNLEPAVFQVTNQLKILTAAAFSVVLLGRRTSMMQFFALVLLLMGVSIVQLSIMDDDGVVREHRDTAFGLITGIGACCTSGLAGVYTEMKLKQKKGMWHASAQLSLFGTIVAFISALLEVTPDQGMWFGFTAITWGPILGESIGGLLTALVMKHADSVLKCFALGVSICVSSSLSAVFFGFQLTPVFGVGVAVVISALFIYNKYPPTKAYVPGFTPKNGAPETFPGDKKKD